MKLAVLSTHPIQYQAPLWRKLAQAPGLDVHVYFGSDFSVRGYRDIEFGTAFAWDIPLTVGYDYTFLSTSTRISDPNGLKLDAGKFKKQLASFQPDYLLLNGYTPYQFYLKSFFVIKGLGIPILYRGEATDHAQKRTRIRTTVRDILLRLFYKSIDKFLVIGKYAYQHYQSKGVPGDKLFWSPYCIDSEYFKGQRQLWEPKKDDTRYSLGFSEQHFVVIYCGKLIPKKDPLIILKSLELLGRESLASLGLLIVGDGSLREALECELNRLAALRAVFVGFQNLSEIGKYYASADCLVLPSITGETWGLVVNEAQAFGTPAIVSDQVGCFPDLIDEGRTGFVFPFGDATALAKKIAMMQKLSAIENDEIKSACLGKAKEYSVDKAVNGILNAIGY